MIPDGVWRRTATGALEFVAVKPPTTEDVEEIVVLVAERCERWLEQQGFGEHDHNDDPDPDDAQILLQAASAAGMAALGRRAGRRARRIQVHRGRVYQLPQRCAVCDGYNLHAGVRIAPRDREGLERLCRYLARPPVGRERLEEQPDGSILLRLKTAWSDGTSAILLSRSELLQRLLAIVPPPRKNDVLFHGVFAPRAAWRCEVVPTPPVDETPEHLRVRLSRDGSSSTDSRHYPWASLLWRVFHEDALASHYPLCGSGLATRANTGGHPLEPLHRSLVQLEPQRLPFFAAFGWLEQALLDPVAYRVSRHAKPPRDAVD